jgi:DUF1365 family protein
VSGFASALYAGPVMHRRIAPTRHSLRYRIFTLLLDLDEIDALTKRIGIFSRNRPNLVAFHDRDHGDGSGRPLRPQIAALLEKAGVEAGGPVRLMCMPRILGFVFNPLSIYFCHDAGGSLAAIVYEVSNTFGERHHYVIPARPSARGDVRQACAKRFYVSPFLDMDMGYEFRIAGPGERLVVGIIGRNGAGAPILQASFCGARRALDARSLARAAATHPLMTLKVVAGIHVEALNLWLKGLRLRPRPPAPRHGATFVQDV